MAQKLITKNDVYVYDALKTPQFWLIWWVLCLNVSAGIGVIGMASPMLQEIFGPLLVGASDAGTITAALTIQAQSKITDVLISHTHIDHIKSVLFLADNVIGRVKKPVNIPAVVKEALSILKATLPSAIPIRYAEEPMEDLVMADPVQIKQVIMNLAVNARDAMPDGGTLSVRTAYDRTDGAIRVEIADTGRGIDAATVRRLVIVAFEGEMNVVMYADRGTLTLVLTDEDIRLEIVDQGPGIPDIDLAMQPGYSTASDELREMGFGFGMGLPNIQSCAASLDITSTVGQGTTLKIAIPTERKCA